jgi:predicted DNA-binding transcriptional regulator AlpA
VEFAAMSTALDNLELIPDSKLRKLLGKSPRTIGRWDDNPSLKFPKPIVINGRKHRRASEVTAWLSTREVASLGPKAEEA